MAVVYQSATPATPPTGTSVAVTNTAAGLAQHVNVGNMLAPVEYDYIAVSYTGNNLTGVVYKLGGAGGAIVATLTIGYDGSNRITSVTKT